MTEEVKRQRSGVQLLISRVDNMRNDIALLRSRVDVSEKAVVEVKNYIKEQLIELYSQIEAAHEMMDEIISFMEELKSEDDEEEETIEDKSEYDNTVVPELVEPEEFAYPDEEEPDYDNSLHAEDGFDLEETEEESVE